MVTAKVVTDHCGGEAKLPAQSENSRQVMSGCARTRVIRRPSARGTSSIIPPSKRWTTPSTIRSGPLGQGLSFAFVVQVVFRGSQVSQVLSSNQSGPASSSQ